MTRARRIRWGDNDRHFGPFTYAKDDRYRHTAIVISSGDDDDRQGCKIRFSGFGHTLIIGLPPIIQPWRKKVMAGWDEQTIKRLGRDWYWDVSEREYGFSCADGFLSVAFGRQTHDSSTEQRWGTFLPWANWRHVRHSFYGLAGEHYWDEPQGSNRLGSPDHANNQAIIEACPTRSFAFMDYDDEHLIAKTRIEEREWRFGDGWFKWLSVFRKPKIRRSLDIRFSGETGRRKGSWKGGTLGHGIDMLPGELHQAAFQRYCAEHDMTFTGEAS